MKITIMGTPCAGKSFVGGLLAKHYKLKQYSIGDLRRAEAAKRGLTIAQFNALDEDTDTFFDEQQKKLGLEEDNFVIDGRMSAYFMPSAISIFLDASEEVRAKRLLTDHSDQKRVAEDDIMSSLQGIKSMDTRTNNDILRYKKHYNFNPYLPGSYDIFLDTTNLNKEEVITELIKKIDSFSRKLCHSS